jgi:hypothetical protein
LSLLDCHCSIVIASIVIASIVIASIVIASIVIARLSLLDCHCSGLPLVASQALSRPARPADPTPRSQPFTTPSILDMFYKLPIGVGFLKSDGPRRSLPPTVLYTL